MAVEPKSVADLKYTCPVCLESLFPPVFQCHNGHLMCQACSSSVRKCGVCRDILPRQKKIRNLEVERIIRMIKHRCPNQPDGCLAEVNFDQMEAHRIECYYTKFPLCRDILGRRNCEEIRICDYEAHVDSRHTKKGVLPESRELPTHTPLNLPATLNLPTSRIMNSRGLLQFEYKFNFEEKLSLFTLGVNIDDATKLVTFKPYVLAGAAVASQLIFIIFSGKGDEFVGLSPVFNVETKPEELLAGHSKLSLPLEYFRAEFLSEANEIGDYRLECGLSRKDEIITLPNEQANSAMESP